jgi:Transposase DDE domain group 1
MRKKRRTPSTSKVRRIFTGGKRGDGHRRTRRIRRPDPAAIRLGKPDPNLTAVGGLVSFGVYLRRLGIDRQLHESFESLKSSPMVIYPMGAQLRLLVDAFALGETRVFGVEALAPDPLFVHLAGGGVPSIDTLYRDLDRFDASALVRLESMMAEQGLHALSRLRGTYVHMDVDTTVTPVFGEHEGARPGPNPRYRGRPSFHPMLARIAETQTIVGGELRPGDTGFGEADVPVVRAWVVRARDALRKGVSLCVRMDSAGDCGQFMAALHGERVFYLFKARITRDLLGVLAHTTTWKTVDRDAEGAPSRQIAELDFRRDSWGELPVRVIAVRSIDRHGRQLPLFEGADWTVQVFLTNRVEDADDIAWDYDGRAGIEPHIAELKGSWGIGEASCYSFTANHAALLLKLLSHNLLHRYTATGHPELSGWRTAWQRRTLLRVPGRLSRSGRGRQLHLPAGSPLVMPLLE